MTSGEYEKKIYRITHGYMALTWIILFSSYLFSPIFHPLIGVVAVVFSPFPYMTVYWFLRSLRQKIKSGEREAVILKIQRLPYYLTFFLYFFDFFIFVAGMILHRTGIIDMLEAMVLAMLVGAYLFFGFENALYDLKREGYYKNLDRVFIPFSLKIIFTFFVFIIIPVAFIWFKLYVLSTGEGTVSVQSIYVAMIPTVLRTIFLSLVSGAILGYNVIFPVRVMSQNMKQVEASDYDVRTPVFTNDELGLLSSGFNRMVEGLEEKERIKSTFGKIVDPVIRDTLLQGNLELGGVSERGVILFSDIRDFTSISEGLDPAALVNVLNVYFEKMGLPIARNSGLINKFIGDAILAIFGIPVALDQPERKAVLAGIGMMRELRALNHDRGWTLKSGIGIHAGNVIAGNIGTPERMEYTVIGDAVNTASRLESITKVYRTPVLATEDVVAALSESDFSGADACFFREIDTVILKGKENPVTLYELFGYEEDSYLAAKIAHRSVFADALREYRAGRFAEAVNLFEGYAGLVAADPLPALFLRRCQQLLSHPPGENWKGIAKIKIK